MEISNLTPIQQGLITDLVNEFNKINPKPTSGVSRFTFETISECLNEEERFFETLMKNNKTMIKLFEKQFKDDIKEFLKEFGKAFRVEQGYIWVNNEPRNTMEQLIEEHLKGDNRRRLDLSSSEVNLFFVSNKKDYRSFNGSDSRYDYFGNAYHRIYVDFNRERVTIKLQSGKEVSFYKVVGLKYYTNEWLHRDKGESYTSLDEFIQNNKTIQQRLVAMVN
jgi:virulence-associated protein VapD